MQSGDVQSTDYLVLRHTPFQESSLVISGISPEMGRLDFLVKGARSQGKKKFPLIGLFRELRVEFRFVEKNSFPSLKSMEPLSNFDALALHTNHYLAACGFAKFLLENTRPMLDAEEVYTAFRLMLEHFAQGIGLDEWPVLVRLAFLSGSGLLPEPERESGRELLDRLFAASQGAEPVPSFVPDYWNRMDQRLRQLLRQNGFSV